MAWQPGEQVGPYRIVQQLGKGGMATVFKAHHAQLDRDVAIKVMHQNFLEDESFLVRFKREARIVAKLEHPHIVPIYDFSEHDGQPYLVMKLIKGETLKKRLSKGALPLDQILHVMTAVSSALDYAHKQDILHRDIKPSNIVIDDNNIPYLADFGLARIAHAGESTMSADMLLGTPNYISPEQAQGKKELDGRTDIYSLGVVLYELVVGRVPYTADTPYAIIHNHIYSPLPLPSLINPDIPQVVEDVLVKALAKNPNERYASAGEMVNDFEQAVKQAELVELDADRVTSAAVSLAKINEKQQAEQSNQPYTTPPGIAAPITATESGSMITYSNGENRDNLWIMGGLATFVLIGFISAALALSIFDNFLQIAEITDNPGQFRASIFGGRDGPQFERYDVPDLTVDEAEALVDTAPEDPVTYLALARAYWGNNQDQQAYDAIRQGAEVVDDNLVYLLTVIEQADELGETYAALSYGFIAFNLAEGNENISRMVRETVGYYIYQDSVTNRIFQTTILTNTLRQITEDRTLVQEIGQSLIFRLYVARNQLAKDRTRLAKIALDDLSSQEANQPESQLIIGELHLAQNEIADAIIALEGVVNDDDAPLWAHERAEQLLETIED